MSQTQKMIDELKEILRQKGKTYADVADHLGVSEATIKRQFSLGRMCLTRLERICTWLDISVANVAFMAEESEPRTLQLSECHEQEIVSDPKLLIVFLCLLNGLNAREIQFRYGIHDFECTKQLTRLDRMKLIELLPGNRVRCLVPQYFRWQKNGPFERYIREKLALKCAERLPDDEANEFYFVNGMLTTSANVRFQVRMQQLIEEFVDACEQEKKTPLSIKDETTLVVAIRKWKPSDLSFLAGTSIAAGK